MKKKMKKSTTPNNPYMPRVRMAQRKRHKKSYYEATASITCSPAVKQGLVEIAKFEHRALSWVVNEVFRMFFGLRDDTKYIGIRRHSTRPVLLHRVK